MSNSACTRLCNSLTLTLRSVTCAASIAAAAPAAAAPATAAVAATVGSVTCAASFSISSLALQEQYVDGAQPPVSAGGVSVVAHAAESVVAECDSGADGGVDDKPSLASDALAISSEHAVPLHTLQATDLGQVHPAGPRLIARIDLWWRRWAQHHHGLCRNCGGAMVA